MLKDGWPGGLSLIWERPMKNFTIICLSATALGLAACGGPSDSGEVTVEDVPTAEITRTEVKTEAVLSAERTSEGLKEQGEKLVGAAEEKAAELKEVSETIKTNTALNADRLKTDGAIDAQSAAQMKDAANERASDLEEAAEEIVEDAKDQAEAMAETGKKMVEEVKEANPE